MGHEPLSLRGRILPPGSRVSGKNFISAALKVSTDLLRNWKKRHPKVELEACASGGGRVDYGALERFDEYWPSDNTDPLDRLFIQEAYSYFYPVKYMRAWLTDDFGMNQRNASRFQPAQFHVRRPGDRHRPEPGFR